MKQYQVIEKVPSGDLEYRGYYDTIEEAVHFVEFNKGRHESYRKFYITRLVTWKTTVEDVTGANHAD